jgi:TetR/AcrR family transcriptional regulator, tetracycline repressor protein
VKLSRDVIARAALGLLADAGLDGLTMRLVATELGVRAPTLYWHVKNKQDLLDAMADLMFDESTAGLEGPGADESWVDWLIACTTRSRATMLRYRDGARVFAGSHTGRPGVLRMVELTLRTLQDGGIPVRHAARSFPVVLHYTVGFTIEQQARTGAAYGSDNPYDGSELFDDQRFPLLAGVRDLVYDVDSDAAFEHGLRLILTGIEATSPEVPSSPTLS